MPPSPLIVCGHTNAGEVSQSTKLASHADNWWDTSPGTSLSMMAMWCWCQDSNTGTVWWAAEARMVPFPPWLRSFTLWQSKHLALGSWRATHEFGCVFGWANTLRSISCMRRAHTAFGISSTQRQAAIEAWPTQPVWSLEPEKSHSANAGRDTHLFRCH